MNLQTDPKFKRFADYFDLPIVYSTELPDKVCGFLNTKGNSAWIVLNAHKSRYDHALTIFHEIAHYLVHQGSRRLLPMPWFLEHAWKSELVIEATQEVKAYYLKTFDREWEANFWAFLILWRIGAVEELLSLVKMYPEMKWMFWYSLVALAYSLPKQLEKDFFQRVADFLRGRD